MLYLRLTWMAGQCGILLASLIVLLSSLVTTLTSLSMCAICTNGEIKGGKVDPVLVKEGHRHGLQVAHTSCCPEPSVQNLVAAWV